MSEEIELQEIDKTFEENTDIVEETKVIETEITQTEQSSASDAKAKMAELQQAKVTLQKNLTNSLMRAVSSERITPADANAALDAFEKAYTDVSVEPTAEKLQATLDDLNSKYGDQIKALDTLLKGANSRITTAFKKLAPDYKLKNQVALDQLGDRIGQELKVGKLDQITLDQTKVEVDKAMTELDQDLPEVKEKVESKMGEKGWKIFKMLLVLGGIVGSLFLIAHFLQEKYDGCYLLITKGPSRKLTCGVDQDHCGCGDAPRNLSTATDAICSQFPEFPYCKGNCRGNPTCSSIDLMVQENGINYSWQSYSPFDALLQGLGDGAKSLADDLGISGIWKYVKYFIYGILGLIALVFVIWIIYEIWEHLPKKKEDHGSDVNIHVDSASTSSV